ncbi:hypothetical protein V8G54_015640 [Vigna mungo]|uniref:Uncharacterized protein n=1 Tax=Vigna mungo TaxID=3915 RepID=A0AAQ3NLH0_VIGMU
MDEDIEVVFHHGGKLVNDGMLKLEALSDHTGAMHMVNLARLNVIHMLEYVPDDEGQVEPLQETSDHIEHEERANVDGEVQGEVVIEEEAHEVKQIDVVLEKRGEVDDEMQGEVVIEEEVHGVEQVCVVSEDRVDFDGQVSSSDDGIRDGNNEWLKGLVDINGGNERGMLDDDWESEDLVSGPDNDEVNDVEGYGTFTTFIMPTSMVELLGEKENPKVKAVDVRGKIQGKWNLKLLDAKWLRKKLEKIQKISDYAHELLAGNPGLIVKVKVEDIEAEFGGKLLMTVGRDANNQMLPIVYVVVEVENKDSWT